MLLRATLLTLTLALAAPAAPAQAPPPPPPAAPALQPLTLRAALDTAKARKRLLILVLSPTTARAAEHAALWSHPALAAWAARHAVAAHITTPADIATLNDAGLATGGPDQPLLAADGLSIRLFGSSPATNTSRLRKPPREKASTPRSSALAHDLAAFRLLLRLEWSLRGTGRTSPAWLAAHDAACPQPPRPVIPAQSARSDAGALSFAQAAASPLDGAAGADMLGRLLRALDLAAVHADTAASPQSREDALVRAAGLFIGLWELGPSAEPHIAPALTFAGARAMHALAGASPATRARFDDLRHAQVAMWPWMNQREWFNHLMLTRVCGAHVPFLDFVDAALSDADAALLMPADERLAWEAMLPRLAWDDPLTLPSTGARPVRFIEALRDRLTAPAPKGMEAAAHKRLLSWYATQFLDESARTYAALLAAERDDDAALVAALAQGAFKDNPRHLHLIAAALARGQPRPHQLEWLTPAPQAAADPATNRIRERLKAALAPGGADVPSAP